MSDWLDDIPRIAAAFVAFVKRLRLGKPQPPILISRKENDMAWAFTFANPPANSAADWTRREFLSTIDGVEQPALAIEPKDTIDPIVIQFPENASVSIVTVDYDDATTGGLPTPNRVPPCSFPRRKYRKATATPRSRWGVVSGVFANWH